METPAYTKLSTAELHMLALNADAEAKAEQNSYDRDQYERFRQALYAVIDCGHCPIQKECYKLTDKLTIEEVENQEPCEFSLFQYVLTGEKPS